MKYLIRYSYIVILALISNYSLSQEVSSCAFKLQEAESLYESGVLDSIPSMLRSCINNKGFDKEELSRAYKLLILTYQFQDYQEMAEVTMLKFLKEFPEYEIKPTDPVEFKYLHNSYKSVPVYSIGVLFGGNYSFIRLLQPYSKGNTEDYNGEYTAGLNLQFGIQIKRYINENIEINLDGIYTMKNFSYKIIQNEITTTYDENHTALSIPITGIYDFNLGTWSPYVRAGINLDYLLKATATFEKGDLKDSDVDIKNERNDYNISAVVGGGLKYNIKMGYLMLDVRYNFGFLNIVNPETRYTQDYKWDQYGYVDDDFTMNNVVISVGYVYPFYKIKQRK